MKQVNLRELYPDTYEDDVYVMVNDEVYETICEFERQESTSARQRRRRETQYVSSYDNRISEPSASPEESVLMTDQRVRIFELVMSLPPKQSKRIYETFYLGKSKQCLYCHSERVEKHPKKTMNRCNKKCPEMSVYIGGQFEVIRQLNTRCRS